MANLVQALKDLEGIGPKVVLIKFGFTTFTNETGKYADNFLGQDGENLLASFAMNKMYWNSHSTVKSKFDMWQLI